MLAEYRARSQITLPKTIVKKIGLAVGDVLDITVRDGGVFMMPVEVVPKKTCNDSLKSEMEKRELLQGLFGSIDDPTFVEPQEIPWEISSSKEEIT